MGSIQILQQRIKPTKIVIQHHPMKSIVFIFGLALAKDPLQNNKEANSVLRAKRSPSDDCGFFGCATTTGSPKSYDEQQKDAADAFITKYHLTSVESWEEMKDKFEENADVPEEAVDELESCVGKCWMEDKKEKIKPGDKSVEERKENQEKAFEKTGDENSFLPRIVPCPKCFRYIPKEVADGIDIIPGIGQLVDMLG